MKLVLWEVDDVVVAVQILLQHVVDFSVPKRSRVFHVFYLFEELIFKTLPMEVAHNEF